MELISNPYLTINTQQYIFNMIRPDCLKDDAVPHRWREWNKCGCLTEYAVITLIILLSRVDTSEYSACVKAIKYNWRSMNEDATGSCFLGALMTHPWTGMPLVTSICFTRCLIVWRVITGCTSPPDPSSPLAESICCGNCSLKLNLTGFLSVEWLVFRTLK